MHGAYNCVWRILKGQYLEAIVIFIISCSIGIGVNSMCLVSHTIKPVCPEALRGASPLSEWTADYE